MHFTRSKTIIITAIALVSFSAILACAAEPNVRYVRTAAGERPTPTVAIDNVCGWPNLVLMPDGTIVATIFGEPSHAGTTGDLECWASEDGGKTWAKRGVPAPHEPNTNRLNFAVGLGQDGDLIVLCAGWSNKYPRGQRPKNAPPSEILPAWLSRSSDGGRTWQIDKEILPKTTPCGAVAIPFGNLRVGDDGTMRVVMANSKGPSRAYVYRSSDDGKTWSDPVPLNKTGKPTEVPLLHLGKGKWFAAGRTNGLQLFVSDDDGKTWKKQGALTGPDKHPGHWLRLKDGKILLAYGNRASKPKGIEVIYSDDEGKTWSQPVRLLDWHADGGYPSSVQRDDGQIVTAYYAWKIEGHKGYHVGTVIWDPEKSLAD